MFVYYRGELLKETAWTNVPKANAMTHGQNKYWASTINWSWFVPALYDEDSSLKMCEKYYEGPWIKTSDVLKYHGKWY